AKVHGHTFLPLPGTPFRRAAPGRLDDATRQALLRLASKGQLYGQWEQQAQVARRMGAPAHGA
ncbi:MAG: TIGR04013 family B12-binding domain/radical SAM domain-containing protein, partial [Planctomycetota bacterium]